MTPGLGVGLSLTSVHLQEVPVEVWVCLNRVPMPQPIDVEDTGKGQGRLRSFSTGLWRTRGSFPGCFMEAW